MAAMQALHGLRSYANDAGLNGLPRRRLSAKIRDMLRRSLHRATGETPQEHGQRERVRYKLTRLGYKLCKDRARTRSLLNQGGYCIRNAYNGRIAAGECFELTLDDVEMFIQLIGYKRIGEIKRTKTRQHIKSLHSRAVV